MTNFVRFWLNSTFPLSHVRVSSVNELHRSESLIILRFQRTQRSNPILTSSYIWSYDVVCKWPRDRLIGASFVLITHPIAPNLHPICGIQITPDIFESQNVPFGHIDNDWGNLLKKPISQIQTVTFKHVSRTRLSKEIPNGKNDRTMLMNHIVDYINHPTLDDSTCPVWFGSFCGIPLWGLLLTKYLFGGCERNVLKYYECFSSCVTPSFGSGDSVRQQLFQSARHVCFPSRTVTVIPRRDEATTIRNGNLFFFQVNGTIGADCEMIKVLYSYHCAKYLRFFKWAEYETIFRRYKECVFEVVDIARGKTRPAFGWIFKDLLTKCIERSEVDVDKFTDEKLVSFQFASEDLLLEDEYSMPCSPATSVLIREYQTRIPYALWKNRYRIVRVLFETGDNVENSMSSVPCVVEFSPQLEPEKEWHLRGRIFVKLWKPSYKTLLRLEKPLQHALTECRTLNCHSLQMKPPKLKYKRKRTWKQDRGSETKTIIAYGSTSYLGPNTDIFFDKTDQDLEINYYDMWGTRDFLTVSVFKSSSDKACRAL